MPILIFNIENLIENQLIHMLGRVWRTAAQNRNTSWPSFVSTFSTASDDSKTWASTNLGDAENPSSKPNENIQQMQIRAVHISRKMDIVQLFQRLYTNQYKVSHYLHKDSIVLRLKHSTWATDPKLPSMPQFNSTLEPTPASSPSGTFIYILIIPSSDNPLILCGLPYLDDPGEEPSLWPTNTSTNTHGDKYVVYFDYGAVVFFNCDDKLTSTLVKHAKSFCTDVFDIRGHEEKLTLMQDPELNAWSELRDSCIKIQQVDLVNIQVIAGILAQTVALEHYERQVDAILAEFEHLNTKVAKTNAMEVEFNLANSTPVKYFQRRRREKEHHRKLFQIVATNNTLLIDLVNKLRVIDRKRPGEAAWEHTRYHRMWENLLEEFELNERFNNLNFKLELIQHNTKVRCEGVRVLLHSIHSLSIVFLGIVGIP